MPTERSQISVPMLIGLAAIFFEGTYSRAPRRKIRQHMDVARATPGWRSRNDVVDDPIFCGYSKTTIMLLVRLPLKTRADVHA